MYLVVGVSGPIVLFIDPDHMRNWLRSATPALLRHLELWWVPVQWTNNRSKRLDIRRFIDES